METKPSDIRVRVPFVEAFGKVEAEYLAVFVVLFLREHGDDFGTRVVWSQFCEWVSATFREARGLVGQAYRNPMWSPTVGLLALESNGWLDSWSVDGEHHFRATPEFVRRVKLSGEAVPAELDASGDRCDR